MTALSKYFGGKQLGEIIPAFAPNESRLLFCDGVQEAAVTANNEFLGQLYPRVSSAVARQYTASISPGFAMNDIAYGNGVYVAVGADIGAGALIGYCMTSTDGRNWIMRTLPVSNNWKFVVWTGAYFLAYGWDGTSSGHILRSDDGMTWVTANTTSSTDYNGVWTIDGMTVALYGSTQYWVTYDGVNWVGQSPNVYPTKVRMFKGMLYGKYSNTLYKSDNGINWVAVKAITGFLDFEVNGAGTTLVCTSSSANLTQYTTDGTNFTTITIPAFRMQLVWNGENFISFVAGNFDGYRTSPDGITWTLRTFASNAYTGMNRLVVPNLATGDVYGIYFGSYFPHTPVLTKTWGFATTTPMASNVTILGVKHNGTRYISYGYYTTYQAPFIATSEDGLNWTQREVPAANFLGQIRDMAFNGNVCVGAGVNGAMIYSNDGGLTWSQKPFANQAYKIACNGTIFVAILSPNTSSQYYTSPDGITWTARNGGFTCSHIAANGGTFGMVSYTGSGNTSFYSGTDGIAWTLGTTVNTSGSIEIYPYKTFWLLPLQTTGSIGRLAVNMSGYTTFSLGQNYTSGWMGMIVTPNAAMLYSSTMGLYSTSVDANAAVWTARSFQNTNQNYTSGSWNAATGEWLLTTGNNTGKVSRSLDMLKWSFYTNGFGQQVNVSVHNYTVKLGTRVVSNGAYRNDGEYFWKPIVIPGHDTTTGTSLLATNGVGIVAAFAGTLASNQVVSIAYSTDGIEWTLSDLISYPTIEAQPGLSVKSVVHDGTYWYIFFNSMFYLRSPDGKVWTKYGCQFSVLHPSMVTAGNGKIMVIPQKGSVTGLFAVAPANSTDPGFYYLSTDGINWTRYQSPVSQAMFVTWGPELGFMITSPSGTDMRFSLDGITWSSSKNSRTGPNGSVGTLIGLRYFNGYYVFTNTGQSMVYTKDGVTWGTRWPSIGSSGGSLNMLVTYVDVDGVINTEAAVNTANTLTTTYTKTNPKVIRAPNITAQAVGNGYSLVVG